MGVAVIVVGAAVQWCMGAHSCLFTFTFIYIPNASDYCRRRGLGTVCANTVSTAEAEPEPATAAARISQSKQKQQQ